MKIKSQKLKWVNESSLNGALLFVFDPCMERPVHSNLTTCIIIYVLLYTVYIIKLHIYVSQLVINYNLL